MATILLVHGAWHGAWCWELVAPLLERVGHKVIAPDLPGMGWDLTPLEDVSVEHWASFIAALARREAEPVILVGHSRAGIAISRAAELAPDRVRCLVYLSAFLVGDGQTLQDVIAMVPQREETTGSLIIAADGNTSVIAPEAFGRVFYNTTSPELTARAAMLSGPEPMASFTTPLSVSSKRWGSVPRFYIRCERDRAISPELQTLMEAASPCLHVSSLVSDHSPFYSAPEKLADTLLLIAERTCGSADAGHEGIFSLA